MSTDILLVCTEIWILLSTDIILMCTKLMIDMMILRRDDGKIVIINRIYGHMHYAYVSISKIVIFQKMCLWNLTLDFNFSNLLVCKRPCLPTPGFKCNITWGTWDLNSFLNFMDPILVFVLGFLFCQWDFTYNILKKAVSMPFQNLGIGM